MPVAVGLDACGGFFFFQAEDGIRDVAVTGVQTCALPISGNRDSCRPNLTRVQARTRFSVGVTAEPSPPVVGALIRFALFPFGDHTCLVALRRSEERRVGKECRSLWVVDGEQKKGMC